jgi:hypothetical protein
MNYQRLIERGVSQWNQWRIQNPNQWPDLRGVNLSQSYLFEINLMGSNLSGVDFSRACLIGADLSRANLSGANLSGAYLNWANLREANLSNADLTEAQMTDADLLRANLAFTCLAPITQALSQTPRPFEKEMQTIEIARPQPVGLLKSPTFSDGAVLASPQGEASTTLPMAWSPELLEKCQCKLSDYYIGPMVTLILDDIINVHNPQTLGQFVERVAAHIPETQEALRFRNSFRNSFSQNSRKGSRNDLPSTRPLPSAGIKPLSDSSASTLTAACIAQCQQQLTQYYIAPMAQMLIDEVMSAHHPKTTRQLVQLIAEQLPQEQAESFVRQVLS